MNARVYQLDDYRKTPAVVLTDAQKTRAELGHEIVESLAESARLERAITEHMLLIDRLADRDGVA